MSGIFLSYRRDDSAAYAGRLNDALLQQFPDTRIFFDRNEIPAGVDFVKKINAEVGACSVLLAVIGPQWLAAQDSEGRRRLDDPSDFVRREIAAGLEREIVVIPVLINATKMPTAEALPEPLIALANRQAATLSDAHWTDDVNRLCGTVAAVPGVGRRREPGASALVETAGAVATKLGNVVGIGATAVLRALAVTLVCAGVTFLLGSNWSGDAAVWRRISDGVFVLLLIYWVIEVLLAVRRIRRLRRNHETSPG